MSACTTPSAEKEAQCGVIVAQLGAREHYEVACMAHRCGRLARLITDFWNPWGHASVWFARAVRSSTLMRAAGRRSDGIPLSKVRPLYGTALRVWWRRNCGEGSRNMYTAALVTGRSFATACIPLLRTGHTAFFGYSGECLEALQHENRAGVRTIVDQVDPARTEYLIVQDEAARHPELALPSQPLPVEFSARLQQEWAEASHVVVNSEWSKRALLEQGVDSDKLVVLPLAYLPVGDGPPRRPRRGDPLKVLWLGTLSLRKGLAYAIEAARLLANAPVRFTFAGPLEVNPANLTFPKNATYIGHVARINAPLVFRRHDVFLFPTLSDGFGMTQLEAMAYGLPVIATRCCAQVVEPGVSGFLVHERTPREITDSILEFLNDPDLLSRMSAAALRRAEDFQPEKIWPILERVMQP